MFVAYSRDQIAQLWVQAGGNPSQALMAAAIALAESGGRPDASNTNPNGTVDRGLFQINSVHGSLSTFDLMANVRAAISISKNGSDWRPWCTAWSNGRCGGTFMGSGSPVLKFLSGASMTDPTFQQQGSLIGPNVTQIPGIGFPLTNPINPSEWANAFLKPVAVWSYFFLMYAAGMTLVVIGLILLVWDTAAADTVKAQVRQKWNLFTAGEERKKIEARREGEKQEAERDKNAEEN